MVLEKLTAIKYKNQFSKYKNAFLKFCEFLNLELSGENQHKLDKMMDTKTKKRRQLKRTRLKDIKHKIRVMQDKKLKSSYETMGIQRPDATIITGQIKNNVSLRICGRFVDPEPSRIMLGNNMATTLPKIRGRFILKDNDYTEFQAFRITEEVMGKLHKIPVKKKIESKTTNEKTNSMNFNFDDIEL